MAKKQKLNDLSALAEIMAAVPVVAEVVVEAIVETQVEVVVVPEPVAEMPSLFSFKFLDMRAFTTATREADTFQKSESIYAAAKETFAAIEAAKQRVAALDAHLSEGNIRIDRIKAELKERESWPTLDAALQGAEMKKLDASISAPTTPEKIRRDLCNAREVIIFQLRGNAEQMGKLDVDYEDAMSVVNDWGNERGELSSAIIENLEFMARQITRVNELRAELHLEALYLGARRVVVKPVKSVAEKKADQVKYAAMNQKAIVQSHKQIADAFFGKAA